MLELEEKIAHLTKTVDELSDVVADQQKEITRLATWVQKLVQREAERDQTGGGGHVYSDERPPHY